MSETVYQSLTDRFRQISALDHAQSMLHWDRAVMMPTGAAAAHAENAAELAAMRHDLMLSDAVSADLQSLLETDGDGILDDWQHANLMQMDRQRRAAAALPRKLVLAASRINADAEMTWRRARKDNDFAMLAPKLREVIDCARDIAGARAEAFGLSPYDALLDRFEAGLTQADIDPLFSDLAQKLPTLVQRIEDRQSENIHAAAPIPPLSLSAQEALARKVMAALGFDFERGRLDVSLHPFTGGVSDDVRITTRYNAADPISGLMAVIHETGHALYSAGLPKDYRQQPVGNAMGMAIHESQSLLLEMQVGRSEAFQGFLLPLIQQAYAEDEGANAAAPPSLSALVGSVQRVERGCIRVDADEVTYPLHVILRYRLEQALLSGDLAVADLPDAWNSGMHELLGVVPETDADGVMQDIHWPSGAFGYFPTYTLGALAAADIYATAQSDLPDLPDAIAAGEFVPLVTWLRRHIHERGRYFSGFQELLRSVTGRNLGTEAFYRHLNRRYLQSAE